MKCEEALRRSYPWVFTLARIIAWALTAARATRANTIITERDRALVGCHGSDIHGALPYGVHNVDGATQDLPIEYLPGGAQGQHCDGEDGGLEETHDSIGVVGFREERPTASNSYYRSLLIPRMALP